MTLLLAGSLALGRKLVQLKLLLTDLNARRCQVLRVLSIFCALALRPHHEPDADSPDPALKPENQETALDKSADLAEKKANETNKTNATNANNETTHTEHTHHNLTDMPSLIVTWLMSRQAWRDQLQFTVDVGPQTCS